MAWRIESHREGVAQVGKNKVVPRNTELKKNVTHVESMGRNKTNVTRRTNQKKKKLWQGGA